MIVNRRDFFKLVASGAVSLIIGGRTFQVETATIEQVLDVEWLQIMSPRFALDVAQGQVRWRLNDGEWKTEKFTITGLSPEVWLTENVTLDFSGFFEDVCPTVTAEGVDEIRFPYIPSATGKALDFDNF